VTVTTPGPPVTPAAQDAAVTRTVYYTATTLDGFVADEEQTLGWLLSREVDADGPMGYGPFIAGIGALAMGATTYRWLRAHEEGWPYDQPCWVFTHSPGGAPEGADVRFTDAAVDAVHPELVAAAAGRDVWVVGGGVLAAQFAAAGLLDEVVVSIAPVTLGAGRPLLPAHVELRPLEVAANGEFACVRYAVVR
jgi:dihydrofolate reductase